MQSTFVICPTMRKNIVFWIAYIGGSVLFFLIHNYTLYPFLSFSKHLFAAFLRMGVLVLTTLLSFLFQDALRQQRNIAIGIFLCCFVFLIPYSFYNLTQVRHIAEICHLSSGVSFVDVCAPVIWKVLLPVVYALLSIGVFYDAVFRVLGTVKRVWRTPTFFILMAYVAFAAVFGLFTRTDTFSLFSDTETVINLFRIVVVTGVFWINWAIFFVIGNLFYFGALLKNRLPISL